MFHVIGACILWAGLGIVLGNMGLLGLIVASVIVFIGYAEAKSNDFDAQRVRHRMLFMVSIFAAMTIAIMVSK